MTSPSNSCVWFEIPTHDMERAKAFYEAVLQTELSLQDMGELKMAWFPMAAGAPGSGGCLIHAKSYVPSYDGTMVYLSVPDIEAALGRVASGGGKVLRGKMSIGEYGFVGHFEDTEGNRVALHSDG
jgi:uncharacterized protein